jgi:hypothetical protein
LEKIGKVEKCRFSPILTVPQAGENSQTNGPEQTIVHSILTYLNLKKKTEEQQLRRFHH